MSDITLLAERIDTVRQALQKMAEQQLPQEIKYAKFEMERRYKDSEDYRGTWYDWSSHQPRRLVEGGGGDFHVRQVVNSRVVDDFAGELKTLLEEQFLRVAHTHQPNLILTRGPFIDELTSPIMGGTVNIDRIYDVYGSFIQFEEGL